MSTSGPPELPKLVTAVIVRPHRAQKILILGVIGFVFAPCGFAAVWLGRRDLRAMASGSMDRSGESLTRLGRMLGIAAGIVWTIKWMILICLGAIVYLNWETVRKHL
jgi:hypothetical protein